MKSIREFPFTANVWPFMKFFETLAQTFGNKPIDWDELDSADTFRAAAIEQLGIWAERLRVEMVRGQYNADPAALCYEAYQVSLKRQAEFLLCDTAGRLHTKTNLMAELQKVKRTLAK